MLELPVYEKRLPRWLKKQVPLGAGRQYTARLIEELRLETVCQSAKCPNHWECWSQGTATFMIAGDRCTRACRCWWGRSCRSTSTRPGIFSENFARSPKAAPVLG